LRINIKQMGDPFSHLGEIGDIWRDLNGLRGNEEELESRLDGIQSRLERLPNDGFRRGTERIIADIRQRVSGKVLRESEVPGLTRADLPDSRTR
jgi:hypothetical protein